MRPRRQQHGLLRQRLHRELHRRPDSRLRARLRECRPEFAHRSRVRKPWLRGRRPERSRQLQLRDRQRPCDHLCQRAGIADRSQAQNLAAIVRADRVPDNQCARKRDKAGDRIRHVLEEVRADREPPSDKGHGARDPEIFHRVRGPARARLDGRRCCRLSRTSCRLRQSPESRCIRADRHNDNGRWSTSGRSKANGNCIRRGNVPGQEGEVRLRWP